ncbi:MAG: hypothetical protein H7Y38_10280 [Armatimonadetes bacterium]|nr:hypothetical protein [Armatimonadota bacterium]
MSVPAMSPPQVNNSVNSSAPRASAYLGFFLFLVGMGMVAYVFWRANALLAAPPPTVPQVTGTDPNGATNAGLALGADIKDFLKQLLVLLLMCVVGSVFGSQGINILFAAWNAKPAAPP